MNTDTPWSGSLRYIHNEFAFNNIDDPGLAGSIVQPYGFDQLAAIYANYRVFASKCSVRLAVMDPQTTATSALPDMYTITIYPFEDTQNTDLTNLAVATGSTLQKVATQFSNTASKEFFAACGNMPGGAPPRFHRVSKYITMKKLTGENNADDYGYTRHEDNTGPAVNSYWSVFVYNSQGLNPAVTTITRGWVKLTYWVKFMKMRPWLPSTTGTTTISTAFNSNNTAPANQI